MDIQLRFPEVSDAESFFRILTSPKFEFFSSIPKSLDDEIKWVKDAPSRRRKGEYNFAVIEKGVLIGGAGIMPHHKEGCAELGYFIDEQHWGRGLATKVLKLLEEYAIKHLKIRRFVLFIHPKNKASIRVGEKAGYHLAEDDADEKTDDLPEHKKRSVVMIKTV